jgi:hypothetical protein
MPIASPAAAQLTRRWRSRQSIGSVRTGRRSDKPASAWLGEGERLAARQRDFAWSALAGIGWRAWRGLELKAQLDAHSAVFDEAELDFLGEAFVLTFGGDYRFASGWQLDLAVSEDIAVESASDVVFVSA